MLPDQPEILNEVVPVLKDRLIRCEMDGQGKRVLVFPFIHLVMSILVFVNASRSSRAEENMEISSSALHHPTYRYLMLCYLEYEGDNVRNCEVRDIKGMKSGDVDEGVGRMARPELESLILVLRRLKKVLVVMVIPLWTLVVD
ncbi:hypothetical protein BT69DRAFT_1297605 [Atractiella rhizophila]|nr:hypothetical protein BT69DRAFT_1297605 [Atractiella rhizophila]